MTDKTFLKDMAGLEDISLDPASKIPIRKDMSAIARQTATTWNKYGLLIGLFSYDLGIDPAVAVAVLCVESGGHGFRKNGSLIIRFENHIFWRRWGRSHSKTFNRHFRFNSGKAWTRHKFRATTTKPWTSFHGDQLKEYDVLGLALVFSEDAALKSISMGLPQVMGFNHKRIGYETAQDMYIAFGRDVRFHIAGMYDFFSKSMIRALQREDFYTFARSYNGSGQATVYGKKIRRYYNVFKKQT